MLQNRFFVLFYSVLCYISDFVQKESVARSPSVSLSVSVSLSFSVSLSLSVSVSLSLSVCLSLSLSVSVCLSVCLSVSLYLFNNTQGMNYESGIYAYVNVTMCACMLSAQACIGIL